MHSQQLMQERGLNLSAHCSRLLTQQDVDQADLILVMERAHREDILARFSRAEGKVWLLSEMAGKAYDIKDPYGGSLQAYDHTRQEIEGPLVEGYQRIVGLAQGQDAFKKGRGLGSWLPWKRG